MSDSKWSWPGIGAALVGLLLVNLVGWRVVAAPVPGAAAQPQPNEKQIEDKAKDLEICFDREIASRKAKGEARLRLYQKNPYTELFLFETLAKYSDEFLTKPAEDFCQQRVIPQYLSALDAEIAADKKAGKDPTLAPAGTLLMLDSKQTFIRSADVIGGKHVRGHSDITSRAMTQAGLQFQEDARQMVMHGAQDPDFWRWNDMRYHAQTDEAGAANLAAASRASVQRLYGLMEDLGVTLKRRLDKGQIDQALFTLGVMCHPTQDLIFHKGMTLTQHAGLSYTLGKNPDARPEPEGTQLFEQATAATKELLATVKKSLPGPSWDRMIAFDAKGDVQSAKVARLVFKKNDADPAEEDISYFELVKYWALSLPYTWRLHDRAELERDLVKWNTKEILAEMNRRVAAGLAK
jgi:hypothetical protein